MATLHFDDYLIERLSHLRGFYGSHKEFVDHLMSGEVTLPITDVLKIVNDYIKIETKKPKELFLKPLNLK